MIKCSGVKKKSCKSKSKKSKCKWVKNKGCRRRKSARRKSARSKRRKSSKSTKISRKTPVYVFVPEDEKRPPQLSPQETREEAEMYRGATIPMPSGFFSGKGGIPESRRVSIPRLEYGEPASEAEELKPPPPRSVPGSARMAASEQVFIPPPPAAASRRVATAPGERLMLPPPPASASIRIPSEEGYVESVPFERTPLQRSSPSPRVPASGEIPLLPMGPPAKLQIARSGPKKGYIESIGYEGEQMFATPKKGYRASVPEVAEEWFATPARPRTASLQPPPRSTSTRGTGTTLGRSSSRVPSTGTSRSSSTGSRGSATPMFAGPGVAF